LDVIHLIEKCDEDSRVRSVRSAHGTARSRRGDHCGRGGVRTVAQGKSNADIAAELFLSEATVKTHITRTFAKLDVTNRVQLTIFAYEAGMVTP
jgi:FixJ family two-component response regulator